MRPSLRRIFFSRTRPRVYFHTSNDHKFLQARSVFDLCGLPLTHFHSLQDPYDEDYTGGRSVLLQEAIDQVKDVLGRELLFFVEDTSICIDALSTDGQEVPGLRAKEWFASTEFEALDAELRSVGNRQASVRSDIALHVPKIAPVFVYGETEGRVAEVPPDFSTNSSHPWLTPDTFNGWFVPAGADRPLGAMSFDESLEHDFRVRALLKLVDKLTEYTAILNLSTPAYEHVVRIDQVQEEQSDLFGPPSGKSVFAVIGPTCAGKTEFGKQAEALENGRHVEASAVLRDLKTAHHDAMEGFELAEQLLTDMGPDVVAREIVDRLLPYFHEDMVVITGFRTIEEIVYLKQRHKEARVIFLSADRRTRYQRQIQRARKGFAETAEEFRKKDKEQESFGLLSVGSDLADDVMDNDGTSDQTLQLFRENARAVMQGIDSVHGVVRDARPRHPLRKERIYRCLRALDHGRVPLTAAEISRLTEREGWRIAQRNVNQCLREFSEFARRKLRAGRPITYQLTGAGLAYLRHREEKARSVADESVSARSRVAEAREPVHAPPLQGGQ